MSDAATVRPPVPQCASLPTGHAAASSPIPDDAAAAIDLNRTLHRRASMKRFGQWVRKGGSVCRTLSVSRQALGASLAVLCMATAVGSQAAIAAPYTVVDLGTLGSLPENGLEGSIPNAINGAG